MRPGLPEAFRWLRQAKHDLEVARKHLEDGFFSDACFMAEQASQKALKAVLLAHGQRTPLVHSVAALATLAARRDPAFAKAVSGGRILDQFYIPTRYPDVIAPPAAPFEIYGHREAREAVDHASGIAGLARGHLRRRPIRK